MKEENKNVKLIKRELYLSRNGGDGYEKEYEETKENNIWSFIVSTPEVDRYGTVIIPSGIDYSAYMNNPIVLAQHESKRWPIGKCLGFFLNGENLEATIEIECITEEGRTLNKLIEAGFVKAVSVGIIPDPNEVEEQRVNGDTVTVYTKSELVEFSIVSVPANRTALIKRSIDETIQQSLQKYKKENRMLTPEIQQKIVEELLPAIKEAVAVEIANLGFTPEESDMASQSFIEGGAPALFMSLGGETEPTDEQVTEPPVAEPPVETVSEVPEGSTPPTPPTTQSFQPTEVRIGKKIAASTQAKILEGMDMINQGCQMIQSAVTLDSKRSLKLQMPVKVTTDELINLI